MIVIDGKTIIYDIQCMKSRYLHFPGWISEPKATNTLNELGFRDKSLLPCKDRVYRFLILGGSTAWGLGATSADKTVAEQHAFSTMRD